MTRKLVRLAAANSKAQKQAPILGGLLVVQSVILEPL
jgi:hypothetical protein